eukprot:2330651-Amphidinium_carterae.1
MRRLIERGRDFILRCDGGERRDWRSPRREAANGGAHVRLNRFGRSQPRTCLIATSSTSIFDMSCVRFNLVG